MSAEYATFGLAPAMRAGEVLANGDFQVHRDFVDFVVDGRPLLFQLSDLDAVSPLASDVPPALFTAQVRGLLLEDDAPLSDGRHIIYGCPECEGIECGAVTALIEREDDDYVWRDFAWQTGERPDLERNGYHGMGPFRFHGTEYRAALNSLLDADADSGRRPRVLLIGPRVALLARLAAALRTIGIGADIARDTTGVPAGELRVYGAVVYGPSVGAAERAAVREAFDAADIEVPHVEGLAPIVPLLVAQVEHALDRGPLELRRLTRLVAADGEAGIEVTSTCRVRLTAYRLDRLARGHAHDVFDGVLETGRHRIPLEARAVKGQSFVVARTSGGVLVEAMAR
ncbi:MULTISPECIES: oxidoreductase [unclassified Streptomyces]|uniref:oxidoreductase n=1 Tax=unclassified Streptomyces TaxID=2593676 RepID=UPI0022521775|nr:oxidoreductase [Streptomyces sp. NBC_00198]MCX5280265.1 oxidoreductase [Streptomyces sp. NBC_00198]